MSERRASSRRDLLTTIAGGAVLGGIWGAAFPAVAKEQRPSIAVVGHRGAQLALIDSTEARALLLVGVPDDMLVGQIAAMMTLFRQRIDLIIGSRDALERRAMPMQDRWSIRHAISLQGKTEPIPISMPVTSVAKPITVSVGAGIKLDCMVGHRSQWHDDQPYIVPQVLWSVQVRHAAGTVTFAPDAASLEATGPGDAGLLVTPAPPGQLLLNRHSVKALAANVDAGAAGPEADITFTRLYPEDIARFAFEDDRLVLPPWTESAIVP